MVIDPNSNQISIHAPHARSDIIWGIANLDGIGISIHAPHARSDSSSQNIKIDCHNFNPRSSCEERLSMRCARRSRRRISIHAPHARSDARHPRRCCRRCLHFNPRSSCEERLDLAAVTVINAKISIHAPHARSDRDFYKRSCIVKSISIHAPHARSDLSLACGPSCRHNFNPRSSCEERHIIPPERLICHAHFNPRSSCEERRHYGRPCRRAGYFNPRSSCEERLAR